VVNLLLPSSSQSVSSAPSRRAPRLIWTSCGELIFSN
jgi:hypothetical protein